MDAAKRIFNLLDPKAKKFFYKLVFAAFLLSLIEMVGISAIMPIIDFSVNFNQIKDHVIYQNVSFYFIFESELEFVIFFAIMTIFFYIFRGLLNIIFIRNLAIYSEGFGAQISKMIFTKYLNLSFVDYSLKNQSTLSKTIISEAAFLSWSIKAMLYLVSEIFVVVTILIMLLIVDFSLTFLLASVLLIFIVLTKRYVVQKIKKIGDPKEKINLYYKLHLSNEVHIEPMLEAFGKVKSLKINHQFTGNDYQEIILKGNITSASLDSISNEFLYYLKNLGINSYVLPKGLFGVVIIILTYYMFEKSDYDRR